MGIEEASGGVAAWLRRLERVSVSTWVLLVVLGLGVAALERFRPTLIEPTRRRAHAALDRIFEPLREVTRGARSLVRRTGNLWDMDHEYRRLQERLMQTETELDMTREQLTRLTRLTALGQWRLPQELEFELADVTGYTTADQGALLILNRGRRHRIEPGLPVVGLAGGLIGVVREVTEGSAWVQCLADPMSAVGVTERETRRRGIVYGRGRERPLEYRPENDIEPVGEGAELISSGLENSVYPKGLTVGRVIRSGFNERGEPIGLTQPVEKFESIEEVLIIRPVSAETARSLAGFGRFEIDRGPAAPPRPDLDEVLSPGPVPRNSKAEP